MLSYEREVRHAAVREGYRSLLKADAELQLPKEYDRICDYYRRVGEACMKWVEAAEGERLRTSYLALDDHRERARFLTAQYRLLCAPVWENEAYVSYRCHSVFQWNGEKIERVMAQVWCMEEQTLLPMRQILKRFAPPKCAKRPPFRPDGVYPAQGELIFYRNGREKSSYEEFHCRF